MFFFLIIELKPPRMGEKGDIKMRILNFGSCNIDSVYQVEHIVAPGETLAVRSVERYPGGKGLNQSIALARAGAPVFHAGCVGADGDMLRRLMCSDGIDLTHLLTVHEATGQAVIQVDAAGENAILVYHGANAMVTRGYIDSVLAEFERGDLLLVQNEISELRYLIEKAARMGMKIVLNPSPFDENLRQLDLDIISYLVLNEVEAQELSGTADLQEFIQWIRSRFPALCVVLTLGQKGSVYFDAETCLKQPAFQVSAADTTAAGDTFTGYFIAGIFQGNSIADALKHASAASAIAVSCKGAASSIPKMETVRRRLRELKPYAYNKEEKQKNTVAVYLTEHLSDASLAELSKRLGYSPSYASRWLKHHMSDCFSNLLARARCEAAAAYLKNTELSVCEIIAMVGYQNETFFREIFAKQYGCSPLQYRKKHKEAD